MLSLFRAVVASLALITASFAAPAQSQERVLLPGKAAGFDGVISQCVSFTRLKFANGMCDDLAKSVASLAKANGLGHHHLGRAEWGFGSDEYLPIPGDTGLNTPVHLTFYIRATGNPVSAFVWISLYEPQDAASGARPGRLVLWEDSGIGAGGKKTISSGLSAGLAKKLDPVFQVLGAQRKQ